MYINSLEFSPFHAYLHWLSPINPSKQLSAKLTKSKNEQSQIHISSKYKTRMNFAAGGYMNSLVVFVQYSYNSNAENRFYEVILLLKGWVLFKNKTQKARHKL